MRSGKCPGAALVQQEQRCAQKNTPLSPVWPALAALMRRRFSSPARWTSVVPHYDISDTNSDPEVVNVDNLLAAAAVQEHNSSAVNQDPEPTWRSRGLLEELNAETNHLDAEFLASSKLPTGHAQVNEEINVASSDSEVEIVGVQEHARYVHPRGGVIQRVSSRKHGSGLQCPRQSETWTGVASAQNWSSPPEVVDLTLDDDSRRKYLL
ncbi:putative protein C18orf25 like [Crotalus adamanteus]|uniref:Uncharacterized protein n=1 Tax=Crotalus adamanteus TaxID=8729 RepID=A0AAW1C3W9_CROAD